MSRGPIGRRPRWAHLHRCRCRCHRCQPRHRHQCQLPADRRHLFLFRAPASEGFQSPIVRSQDPLPPRHHSWHSLERCMPPAEVRGRGRGEKEGLANEATRMGEVSLLLLRLLLPLALRAVLFAHLSSIVVVLCVQRDGRTWFCVSSATTAPAAAGVGSATAVARPLLLPPVALRNSGPATAGAAVAAPRFGRDGHRLRAAVAPVVRRCDAALRDSRP